MDKVTYSIDFNKKNWMRFISHLDLMRLFSRAIRRADFKLYFSKGFSPRPIIRIREAIKLGLEGKGLEAEFVLLEHIDPNEFKKRLQIELPEGIYIEKAEVKA
ncbi:TIGR03936 family radical SAM-associated protein [Candidatus Omnitrophota bacterium]